jgi:hypothetical protein
MWTGLTLIHWLLSYFDDLMKWHCYTDCTGISPCDNW